MTALEGRRLAHSVGIVLVAATGWLSLDPYFTWHTRLDLIVTAFGAAIAAALFLLGGFRPPKGLEIAGVVAITVFAIYITIQPKTDGGHTRWVGVLPTLWAVTLLSDHDRRRCLQIFGALFALSLLPGLVFVIAAAAGLPLTLRPVEHPNAVMGGMLMHWGAVFLSGQNSSLLPWGGVLFRLCGMFDEPGMVGTVSALLLAAYSYRVFTWRTAILYIGGLLSFSLAFIAMTAIGLMVRAMFFRTSSSLALLVPVAIAASLALGFIRASPRPGVVTNIRIETPNRPQEFTTQVAPEDMVLRHDGISERVQPEMRVLIQEYKEAGWATKLFGIASDASATRGGASSSISRLFVDHGLFGAVVLATGIGLLGWHGWRQHGYATPVALFVCIFVMSMYQRPVVWMPYSLVILVCGMATAARHEPGWSDLPIRWLRSGLPG